MIDNTVRTMILSKKLDGQEDEYNRWKDRVNNYKQWKNKHKLTDYKVGDKIDVRDTEYIWCVGTIELKITSKGHPPVLYIHYEVLKYYFKLIYVGMES